METRSKSPKRLKRTRPKSLKGKVKVKPVTEIERQLNKNWGKAKATNQKCSSCCQVIPDPQLRACKSCYKKSNWQCYTKQFMGLSPAIEKCFLCKNADAFRIMCPGCNLPVLYKDWPKYEVCENPKCGLPYHSACLKDPANKKRFLYGGMHPTAWMCERCLYISNKGPVQRKPQAQSIPLRVGTMCLKQISEDQDALFIFLLGGNIDIGAFFLTTTSNRPKGKGGQVQFPRIENYYMMGIEETGGWLVVAFRKSLLMARNPEPFLHPRNLSRGGIQAVNFYLLHAYQQMFLTIMFWNNQEHITKLQLDSALESVEKCNKRILVVPARTNEAETNTKADTIASRRCPLPVPTTVTCSSSCGQYYDLVDVSPDRLEEEDDGTRGMFEEHIKVTAAHADLREIK